MNRVHLLIITLLITTTKISLVEARSYQVDIVVFSDIDDQSGKDEFWPVVESLPDFEGAINLEEPSEVESLGDIGKKLEDFVVLPNELRKFKLDSKLEDSKNLAILLSTGWRQSKPENTAFEYVYLHSEPIQVFSSDNDLDFSETAFLTKSFSDLSVKKFQGLLGIRVSHLMYVDLDFVFMSAEGLVRLTESRKIKLRELNYFDHPLFGVLVLVSPVNKNIATR